MIYRVELLGARTSFTLCEWQKLCVEVLTIHHSPFTLSLTIYVSSFQKDKVGYVGLFNAPDGVACIETFAPA